MKKVFITALVLFAAITVSAEKAVLIDFTTFAADTEDGQNSATLINLGDYVDYSLSPEDKARLVISYAIENWRVVLEPTARNTYRMNKSQVKEAISKGGLPTGEAAATTTTADGTGESAPVVESTGDTTVMGFRAIFPDDANNYYADVMPLFEIPVFYKNDNGEMVFQEGRGVVMNCGFIKTMEVTFNGRNYPMSLEIILINENREKMYIPMGTLDYLGWKTLTWKNKKYLNDSYNRNVEFGPVYPQPLPYWKLYAVRIRKDAQFPGGNFIGYIKDITITYDKAVVKPFRNIDDEDVWHIREEEGMYQTEFELRKLARNKVKIFLEENRMDQDE
jgi:hypothetical protein